MGRRSMLSVFILSIAVSSFAAAPAKPDRPDQPDRPAQPAQPAQPGQDEKEQSLLGMVQAKPAPQVSDAQAVKLTPEQEAQIIEASMLLEDQMVEGLRSQVAEWAKTKTPAEVDSLLRQRIEELSSDARYHSLFGDRPAQPPVGPDVWEETVRAYQHRSKPGTPRYAVPTRQALEEMVRSGGQDSAAVQSAGSAQEVYEGNKAAFQEVCQKYASADQQGGGGLPRAILGILYAETDFGKGCNQAKSGTCGTPSVTSKAMNGAQRNAAYRIGSKGMFGPWSPNSAPASSAGAAGICQFLPGTAEMHLGTLSKDFGKSSANLFAFDGCIPMVAIYLKDYLGSKAGARRPGIHNAVRAYNGGAGFKESNPETKKYGQKVDASMKAQSGVPETCREVLQQSR